MPMITISGPEKAGKTTLISEISRQLAANGQFVFSRHWAKINTDLDYLDALKVDLERVAQGEWVLWDRSWICEHVYAKLLERDGRFGKDPWLAQWLYGRAVDTVGVQAILLPIYVQHLIDRRDETDLPVDPYDEYNAYFDYARMCHLERLYNHDQKMMTINAQFLIERAQKIWSQTKVAPPDYAGRPDASVVIIGEERNEKSTLPGSWLPFTSPMTTQFARALGSDAFQVGWTNAVGVNPAALRKGGRSFIACGDKANIFARRYINSSQVLEVPHPSYLFRWGKAKPLIPDILSKVRTFIK